MSNALRGKLAYKGERGYSAYEIAVQNGYVGSEKDWLSNLGTTSKFERDNVIYIATEGQTEFDTPSSYVSGSFIDVYVEGERLNSEEYTINEGKIVLTNAITVEGTKVEVLVTIMSTNELPIIENLTESSTNDTVLGAKSLFNLLSTNVRTLGAVGDGVTDDTEAIQYALDNYNTVYFPKGEYLINSGLEIKNSNTILKGDNAILNYQGDDYFINVNTQITRFKIEDLNIKGNNNNSCFNFNNGIVDSSIENVRVENFNIGLHSTYSWCVSVINSRIHNCIRPLDLISQSNNFNFINCSFSTFSSQNILTNAEGVAFIGCNITNNETTKAIKLFQSSLTLINCYFEKLYSDYTIECGNNNEQLESVLTIDGGNITDKYISIIGNNSYIKFSNLRKGKIKIKKVWSESDKPSIGNPIKSLEMPSNYKGTRCNSHTFFDDGVDYTFSRYGSGVTLTQELTNGVKQLILTGNTEAISGGIQISNLEVEKDYILEIEGKTPSDTTLLFQQSGVGYGVNIALTGEKIFIPFTAFTSTLRVRWSHTDAVQLSTFKIYEI